LEIVVMAEEKAAAQAEAPQAAKSNMVLIVIIAVLSTLVVGGGAAGFLMLSKGDSEETEAAAPAEAEEDADAKPAAKKKGAKDKDKKDSPKGPAIYIGMEPPFVVNFDTGQASRFLQVTVQVMTRDADTAKLVQDNDPMLRNDLLLLFGSQDSAVIATRDGKEELRKLALDTVKTVVKAEGGAPEKVEAVFFTTFVMQ
jgi:flagellar FliL protein